MLLRQLCLLSKIQKEFCFLPHFITLYVAEGEGSQESLGHYVRVHSRHYYIDWFNINSCHKYVLEIHARHKIYCIYIWVQSCSGSIELLQICTSVSILKRVTFNSNPTGIVWAYPTIVKPWLVMEYYKKSLWRQFSNGPYASTHLYPQVLLLF